MTKEEITQVYRENVKGVYSFFYSRTYSKEISEDLTTDVFLAFTSSVKQKTTNVDDYVKYLYGITRNIFMKYLREKYQHTDVDIEGLEYEISQKQATDNHTTPTLEERALKFLPQIPKSQRKVLTMRVIDKKSLKEIAEELGKDMNYVKTTQKRAIKSMKKAIACTPNVTNILKEDE